MQSDKSLLLCKKVSLIYFIFSLLLSLVYLLITKEYSLGIKILAASFVFLIPYFLCLYHRRSLAIIFLSYSAPLLVILISILTKMDSLELGYVNAVNYFDIRILLFCSVIIPFALIDIIEYKLFTVCIIPSLLSLIFFDPIHDHFKIGFYDVGLESRDYYFSANLYSLITYFFICITFIFLKRQNFKSEFRYIHKNSKLQNYLDHLVSLSQSKSIQNGFVDKISDEILNAIITTKMASRISIWNYDQKTNCLECYRLYDESKVSSDKILLDCNDYPDYIKEIRKEKILLSVDAMNDPMLHELKQYLKENDIKSMLDVPFYRDGDVGGIICLEQQKLATFWSPEDTIYVKALSDFLSYAIIAEKLNKQYLVIKEKNAEIEKMNLDLENKITLRTKELETKNEQLSEFAFLNSHKLRGPIARIEGLFNVLELTQSKNYPEDIHQAIRDSIKELDQVSRRINKSIEHYGTIKKEVEIPK